MNATITVNFAGGAATTSEIELTVTGASIAVTQTGGLSLNGMSVPAIAIEPGAVTFACMPGASFPGRLALPLALSGPAPAITLNNLAQAHNPATVSWPTAYSLQTQILTPGDPLVLTGIIGS